MSAAVEIYTFPNAYFQEADPTIDVLAGWDIPEGFWSRHHEYLWAMQYAQAGMIVADMGCGWHYRPFHDALDATCQSVYAVDAASEVRDLPPMKHGIYVAADFSKKIDAIPAGSLDRVFCISVLEELISYTAA